MTRSAPLERVREWCAGQLDTFPQCVVLRVGGRTLDYTRTVEEEQISPLRFHHGVRVSAGRRRGRKHGEGASTPSHVVVKRTIIVNTQHAINPLTVDC